MAIAADTKPPRTSLAGNDRFIAMNPGPEELINLSRLGKRSAQRLAPPLQTTGLNQFSGHGRTT